MTPWLLESWVGVAGILTTFERIRGHTGRMAMSDKLESKAEASGQPEKSVRRPWHAPQFQVADLSHTKASTHANTDGATTGADGTLS